MEKSEEYSLQLPNRINAFVQPSKLTEYLLLETHPDGGSKAKFFRALGFNETNLKLLESELLNVARKIPAREIIETVHGVKYVIVGSISTPVGKSVTILTVWIIDKGKIAPRLVTARPYKKRNVKDVDQMINEHDVVFLTHDLQKYGLEQGHRGTVVHCYARWTGL